jgi:hypothetical protein
MGGMCRECYSLIKTNSYHDFILRLIQFNKCIVSVGHTFIINIFEDSFVWYISKI